MHKYILRRLLMLIPVIIGITLLVFSILKLTPGDPADMILGEMAPESSKIQLREELGLNDPFFVQYGKYMLNMLRGNFGRSYVTKRDVAKEIFSRFSVTARLGIFSMLVSAIIAIPVGIISATKQYSLVDNVSMVTCLIFVSIPNFWLGLMLLLLFSVHLGWLPAIGSDSWRNFILPTLTLGTGGAANIARMMRSNMLEVIRQDYIRTAKAKGVKQSMVIRKHALKNALMPVVTIMGLQFGGYLGGAILTETVYSMSGTGRLLLDGIRAKDMPMVLGCLTVVTLGYSFVNLLVDLVYGFLDPRIRANYT